MLSLLTACHGQCVRCHVTMQSSPAAALAAVADAHTCAVQARTADMLSESRRLRAALQTSEARSGLVQQFLQQYQLSHDEVYALKVRRSAGGCRASFP
jgi:Conserved oligomeric complex COG6